MAINPRIENLIAANENAVEALGSINKSLLIQLSRRA